MNKKIMSIMLMGAFALSAVTPVSAATIAELQAMIAQLQAQIVALTGANNNTASSHTYNVNLTLGSTGADVVALQTMLQNKGFLVIPSGISKGYFGGLTQSALAQYQASVGISPATGYFGPITRAHFNGLSVSTPNPSTPDTSNPDDSTDTTGLRSGEASLEDYSVKRGSDSNVEEGDSGEVAVIKFDVEDGDAKIERLDLTFVFAGTTGEDEPWDVIDRINLYDKAGKKIASKDVSDEDDWLEEDSPYVFRFSNLNYVVKKGNEAKITVEIEAAGSVDNAHVSGANDWMVYVDSNDIRAIDGDGISQYAGNPTQKITFGIKEEGADESIKIKSSSSNPKTSTLFVEANKESTWHKVFVFDLEGEENDIDLEDLVLTMTTGTEDYDDVISDVKIKIDGDEFDDFDVVDGDTTSAELTFDIDKDFTIDADDTVEIEVFVKFLQQNGNYVSGSETIQVEATSVSGEGKDDVEDTSSISSEVHTLNTSVAKISGPTYEIDRNTDGGAGVISWAFKVTAEEDDVTFSVADNANVDGSSDGVRFTLFGRDTTIATASLIKVSGNATYAGGVWTITEGQDAEFVLDVMFTTVDALDNGTYRVRLNSVAGSSVDKTSTGLNLSN